MLSQQQTSTVRFEDSLTVKLQTDDDEEAVMAALRSHELHEIPVGYLRGKTKTGSKNLDPGEITSEEHLY